MRFPVMVTASSVDQTESARERPVRGQIGKCLRTCFQASACVSAVLCSFCSSSCESCSMRPCIARVLHINERNAGMQSAIEQKHLKRIVLRS